MIILSFLALAPVSSFAASKAVAKVPVKKAVVQKTTVKKVVPKKKAATKAKKKWNGTSKLLSAPLIDPNNPPGGRL